MPRSILQNVVAFDLELRTGVQLGAVHQSITAAVQMAQDQPPIFFVTTDTNRVVVLPSLRGTTATPAVPDGRVHVIINEGSSTITVEAHQDDNFVAVGSAITANKGGIRLIADTGATTPVWIPQTIP